MNKLDQLRSFTDVVADTGDIEAIAKFKPVDATTNPSLLLKAALLPKYEALIAEATQWASGLELNDSDKLDALCDYYAVLIGCEILNLVPGRVSTAVSYTHLTLPTKA